jgi:hypothetical protein
MKPDWQNKSYAKNGAPAGPSTTHPKLKVGMTNLHSKIAVANHNMPQAPKPVVRKFADGGAVRTRSAEEIGDTDPRTGKVDPGSYDRRAAQGEKNLQMLKDAFNKFTGEKSTTAVKENESNMSPDSMASTYYTGNKATDTNKASDTTKPMDMKSETEPSYMKDVRDTLTKPKAESTMTMPEEPAAVKTDKPSVAKTAKPSVAKSSSRSMPAPTESKERRTPNTAARMSPVGNSQKDVEYMAQQKNRQRQYEQASNTDTGDETKRLRDRTSTFVPGFGQIDKDGKIIPNVRSGRMASQVYGAKEDSFMESAEKRYLKSRIDAGNLTPMERAQAKRAGLI